MVTSLTREFLLNWHLLLFLPLRQSCSVKWLDVLLIWVPSSRANNYQSEESEKLIGDWMEKKGNRDQMVIATKYTTAFRTGHGDKEIIANTTGNGTKSLHVSVEQSLKKLKTTYIDLVSGNSCQ